MSINWIKITDRAREGIKLINALPYDTFTTVLLYVHRQMSPKGAENPTSANDASGSNSSSYSCQDAIVEHHASSTGMNESVDAENALEELERLCGIPRPDFLLLIKTFSYILRRITTFIIKPSQLQKELREKLQLDDQEKIDAIVRLWVRQTMPIINNLADENYESNVIDDVAWQFNVEVANKYQKRVKIPMGVLQLKTEAAEDINIEMNHEELLQLFNQFDAIQNELDATLANFNNGTTSVTANAAMPHPNVPKEIDNEASTSENS